MQSFHPPESEKAKRLLSIALLCSERLVKLLNDLLDLSKLEAGKVELNKTLVRISDLLADAAASVETYQLEKKVRIEIASLNAEVYVDKDRIIQVLINLFSNALKFSPTNGIIHVTARRTRDQTIRFSVRDEGPGISKENQLKLFGKFEQLVPEDGIDRVGSGLGLAIVKALVTQHEGKIGVHSIVGQGAEFWFEVQEAKSQKLLRTSGSDFKPLK
jgi:signal transduction histidine kinase